MKFSLNNSLEILRATPAVLGTMLSNISNEWLVNNEGEGTWNVKEILSHLIHCEEEDWIPRMKIIQNEKGDKKFEPFDRTKGFEIRNTKTIAELIKEFTLLRDKSISYILSSGLTENELDRKGIHPEFGTVTLRQLLSTWVVHDLSHIAQINRVMAYQFIDEIGTWSKYIPFLKRKNDSGSDPSKEENRFDWSSYYKNKSNQVPRETLLKVLEIFEKEKEKDEQLFAIDLGCGHGADTIELLKRNWKVLAIDKMSEGLQILEDNILPSWKRNFRKSEQLFEDMNLINCNLLVASYSLPFCKPEYFNSLWKKIESSILPGGRFAGNFFGNNDSWSDNKQITFHSEDEVKNLFRNFQIEYFHERDEDGVTSSGESKHWHVFSVIARKV